MIKPEKTDGVFRSEPDSRRRTLWTVTPDGKFMLMQYFGGGHTEGWGGVEIQVNRAEHKHSTAEIMISFDNPRWLGVAVDGRPEIEGSELSLKFEGGNEELPRLADFFRLVAEVLDGQMTADPEHPWSSEHINAMTAHARATGQTIDLDKDWNPVPKQPKRRAKSVYAEAHAREQELRAAAAKQGRKSHK